MTPTGPSTAQARTAAISRGEAERFLYAEARLADEHRYDEWEALWTDDGVYWVPAGPASDASPDTRISIIFDNRSRIALRVAQLKTGKRHSQDPASNLARMIGNIEITHSEPGSVETRATFIAVESRIRGLTTWAGTVHHTLTRAGNEIRMARKVVTLVNRDQPIPTLSFLI
jgi:3-phenylpropionate/cinnamic acid dioxygenase small subunit